MRHHLALAALIALSGSIAHAAPTKKKPVVTHVADDEDADEAPRKRKGADGDGEAPRKRKSAVADDTKQRTSADEDDAPRAKKRKGTVADDAKQRTSTDEDEPRAKKRKGADDDAPPAKRKVADDDAPRAKRKVAGDDEAPRARRKVADDDEAPLARRKTADEEDGEAPRAAKKSAVRTTDDEDAAVEAPVRVTRSTRTRAKDWNVALGPYLWASSVDANVSIGPANVSSGVDFLDVQKRAKYGIPLAGEAHYGRFGIYADMMYGVIGLDGAGEVGPLMVGVDGTISSLMADGAIGYLLLGGERSLLSVEGRVGMRYQRTAISAALEVAGTPLSPPEYIDASSDALVGGHVALRPRSWFYLSSTFDVGVFGASTSTWSAMVEGSFRVGSHVLLSLGWKHMVSDKANVSLSMHGPRAAIQLTF